MFPSLLLAIIELFTRGLAPIAVGDTPRELLSQGACVRCHAGESHEWEASRHGQAWTNPIFQREYRQQPLAWCVNCHAPLAVQQAELRAGSPALADEGVNCAVCHVRDGKILAASKSARSPHDTMVRGDFGGAAFCAGCHQFDFPIFGDDGQVARYSTLPMQATVAQFLDGPYAGGDCRACHAQSPSKHAFPGAHDSAMLTRALALTSCRDGATVEIALSNRGAGHRVPTGDVHRHIALRAWRSSAPEKMFETLFGRRFQPVASGGKETVSDTTIPPGERRTFRIPQATLGDNDDPINIELRYVYTIDEYPLPNRTLSEPTWTTIAIQRAKLHDLPICRR